jgi:hypothetical protein
LLEHCEHEIEHLKELGSCLSRCQMHGKQVEEDAPHGRVRIVDANLQTPHDFLEAGSPVSKRCNTVWATIDCRFGSRECRKARSGEFAKALSRGQLSRTPAMAEKFVASLFEDSNAVLWGGPLHQGATTFEQAERQVIIDALKAASGRVSGRGGAAERLALKRTTLQNKMR